MRDNPEEIIRWKLCDINRKKLSVENYLLEIVRDNPVEIICWKMMRDIPVEIICWK